jgi:hypothetical protein
MRVGLRGGQFYCSGRSRHAQAPGWRGFGFSGHLDSATGAVGAAAGYVWNDRVAFEGELNFLPSSEADGLAEVDTKVWSLTGNLLYHFAGRRVVPYGVIGIEFGHANADPDNSLATVDDSSTSFIVNLVVASNVA